MRLVVARQSGMPDERRCRKCGEPKGPGRCRPCRNAYSRAWAARNPERAKHFAQAWAAAHRQQITERGKAWDVAHPERTKERHHASYIANREKVLARSKARRLAYPSKWLGYAKRWRDANPDKVKAFTRAASIRHHGLTVAQFDALLAAQGGACRICDATEPGGRGTWHIDHDHECCPGNRRSCGRCVRGVLCSNCNLMLGNAHDNPEVLRRAIEYLMASKALRLVPGKP